MTSYMNINQEGFPPTFLNTWHTKVIKSIFTISIFDYKKENIERAKVTLKPFCKIPKIQYSLLLDKRTLKEP